MEVVGGGVGVRGRRRRLEETPQSVCGGDRGRHVTMRSSDDKYQLRPRAARARAESRSRRQPAPLNKYRRKTANARERSRMREINRAFETLRRAVPASAAPGLPAPCEKLTKITTLRLAMRYIAALTAVLREEEQTQHCPLSPNAPEDSWSSPVCSDLSEFSSELGRDTDDSLTPFETFLAEFDYVDRDFL